MEIHNSTNENRTIAQSLSEWLIQLELESSIEKITLKPLPSDCYESSINSFLYLRYSAKIRI